MKVFILLFVLCVSSPALAQGLPSNFDFKRETGQETGVPYFMLAPSAEAMTYDALRGSTFEALGALAQPERSKYGLIFFNYKEQYQLHLQREKGVILEIDGEVFRIPNYKLGEQKVVGLLKAESAAISIDKTTFEKLVTADDVVIRVGIVAYNLDQDNIDALHFYGVEIQRDLARRKKLNK